jgi:hypothetical protein
MLDERRRGLGIPMLSLDGMAGLQPGYWAHCRNPEARHGRVARRKTLNKVFWALFPRPAVMKGWRVLSKPRIRPARATKRRTQRAPAGREIASDVAG